MQQTINTEQRRFLFCKAKTKSRKNMDLWTQAEARVQTCSRNVGWASAIQYSFSTISSVIPSFHGINSLETWDKRFATSAGEALLVRLAVFLLETFAVLVETMASILSLWMFATRSLLEESRFSLCEALPTCSTSRLDTEPVKLLPARWWALGFLFCIDYSLFVFCVSDRDHTYVNSSLKEHGSIYNWGCSIMNGFSLIAKRVLW